MDHSASRNIYCAEKPAKTVRIQKFLEEISDYSFTFEHVSGKKHVCVGLFVTLFR